MLAAVLQLAGTVSAAVASSGPHGGLLAPPAALLLPSFFADLMVLQRGNATLWGWAPAGAVVRVDVFDATTTPAPAAAHAGSLLFSGNATADSETGRFDVAIVGIAAHSNTTVSVSSTPAATAAKRSSAGGADATGAGAVALRSVAFGDVFLCAGQSNMQYPMADAFGGDDERAYHADFPDLRMLTLKTVAAAADAQDVPSLAPYVWAPSSAATISPRTTSGSFGIPYPSAACFFAVRELLRSPPPSASTPASFSGGRSGGGSDGGAAGPAFPIGIITAAVGGTPIEKWMPPAAVLDGTPATLGGNGTCGGTVPPLPPAPASASGEAGVAVAAVPGNATCNPGTPGVSSLYHGMIAPLLPMRLSAVMWYQGEENDHADDACPGPAWYRCLFPAQIRAWREAFGSPALPFAYVLLAGGHKAVMREAQAAGAGALPRTGFASAMDLGAYGDEYLIPGHPPRKQEVGRRLSLLLRALVYNESVAGVGRGGAAGGGSGDGGGSRGARVAPAGTAAPLARGPRVVASRVVVVAQPPPPPQRRQQQQQQMAGGGDVTATTYNVTATIPFELDADVEGTLHLNCTGSCSTADVASCCGVPNVTASWVVGFASSASGTLSPATRIAVDAAAGVVTAWGTVPLAPVGATPALDVDGGNTNTAADNDATVRGSVEVRVLFEDAPTCALYSGNLSGPDSVYAAQPHWGLVAEMWRGTVNVTAAAPAAGP